MEEGQEKSFQGYVVDDKIYPSSCIVLNGADEVLLHRVRDLPEAAIQGSHYTAEDMARRLKLYRTANNSEVAEPSVQDFFARNGIKVFNESTNTPQQIALAAFKIYIERVSYPACSPFWQNEKPYNYMTHDEVEEQKRRVEYERAIELKRLREKEKVL